MTQDILDLRYSFSASDKVWHSYKTTGKILNW